MELIRMTFGWDWPVRELDSDKTNSQSAGIAVATFDKKPITFDTAQPVLPRYNLFF